MREGSPLKRRGEGGIRWQSEVRGGLVTRSFAWMASNNEAPLGSCWGVWFKS